MTDTRGLSRHEHLLVKLEEGCPFTPEEMGWAAELLSSDELARLSAADEKEPV